MCVNLCMHVHTCVHTRVCTYVRTCQRECTRRCGRRLPRQARREALLEGEVPLRLELLHGGLVVLLPGLAAVCFKSASKQPGQKETSAEPHAYVHTRIRTVRTHMSRKHASWQWTPQGAPDGARPRPRLSPGAGARGSCCCRPFAKQNLGGDADKAHG